MVGFIDDDCIPAADWLESALRVIRRTPDSSIWIGQDYPVPEAIHGNALETLTEEHRSLMGLNDPWELGPTGVTRFSG